MSKNLEHFAKLKARKAQRYSRIGRAFEKEMVGILEKMEKDGDIAGFTAHSPHSEEDHEGRDFTVRRVREGEEIECSFGVTISNQSLQRAKLKHPHVPQFWFPIGTKPETIRKRILTLFKD